MPKQLATARSNLSGVRSVKFVVLVSLVVWVIQIMVSNQLATAGSNLKKVDDRIKVISENNNRMERLITEKSSLLYLGKQASEMGLFVSPKLLTL